MESATAPLGDRSVLERSPLGRLPDRALKYGLTALALLILALIVYFFVRLVGEARPAFAKEGVLGFIFSNNWNVNAESFGAFPLVVGTLITSALALVIGVPVAAALALGAAGWEMSSTAVLPYGRAGIVGGAVLGLGRAIGETVAVTILIGDAAQLGKHLFGRGYSLAAAIANEFGEAQGLHRN